MRSYKYKIKTKEGIVREGSMEAENRYDLARMLRADGGFLLRVEEKGANGGGVMKTLERATSFLNRVSLKDKLMFANNLSVMISAGLSLARSINVIQKQTNNPKFKKVIEGIFTDVTSGMTLSAALAKFPNVYNNLFIAMVKSGEETGNLPGALKIVATQLSKSYELRRKIRGAMIYPSIILIVITIIGVLMMIFLVPTLAATFEELDAELPLATRIIMATSAFFVSYWFVVLLFIITIGVFLWWFLGTSVGKRALAFTLLHLPLVKNITKQANAVLVMRTLSSLISAGVGMVAGLEITKGVIQNSYYSTSLDVARARVQEGEALSSLFSKRKDLYLPLVYEMTEVGEETGKLADMLMRGAEFYEAEVDAVTKNLSVIIEPALLIFVGVAVGFFAISVIQPLYSLGDFI